MANSAGSSKRARAASLVAGIALGLTLPATLGCGDDGSGDGAAAGSGGSSASGGTGAATGGGGTGTGGASGAGTGSGGAAGSSSGTGGAGTGGAGTGGAGTGGAGTGGSGGAPLTADEFWTAFARAQCQHYMHCPGEPYAGMELKVTLGGDLDRCATELASHLIEHHRGNAALSAGVAAGALRISPAAAEACIAATARCGYPLWNLPADEIVFRVITPCREAFEGNVADGGPCERDEECAGDARCLPTQAPATCGGTCAPRLAAGETCELDRDCAGPVSPTTWPTCRNYRCVVREHQADQQLDEDCSPNNVASPAPCAPDLWCANYVCTAPLAANDMCTTEDPTRPDLSVCMDGDCVGEVCTPLVIRRTAGEPCDENRGVMCDKFENLRCTGTCVEGTGATCTNDDHIWFYANCEPEPGLIVNGQCAKGDDCASGVCGVDQNCAAGLCPG